LQQADNGQVNSSLQLSGQPQKKNSQGRFEMCRYSTMLSLLLLGAVAAPLALAGEVTTYGAGLKSCQAYLDARDGAISDEVIFIDWLGGYMSAVNRTSNHRNNILGLTDLKVALERLDNNCRARPEQHFVEAASLLVLGAQPGPATHAIEVTTYGSADKACHVFVEAREQQQADSWVEFLHWLGGYLSGVNATSLRTNNVLGDAELADAVHWLDTFCSAHPGTAFGAAVDALIADSSGAREQQSLLTGARGVRKQN
jgi:hypothetical protein